MAAAKTFILTLHPKLQAFVQDLIGGVLKDASKFHYKNEKFNKMPPTIHTPPRSVGMWE